MHYYQLRASVVLGLMCVPVTQPSQPKFNTLLRTNSMFPTNLDFKKIRQVTNS